MAPTNGTSVDQSASPDEPTNEDNNDLTVREQRQMRRESARSEAIRQRSNHDRLLTEFQPDAVEIETRSVPGGARWTLYTVVALLISAVAWSCWAEVDKIVTAQGKLITVDPPVVIDTSVAAQIRTMNAEFGDRVQAGDVLATLDPTYPEADLKQLQGRIESLDALIARLNAERDSLEFDPPQADSDPNFAMERSVFVRRKAEFIAKQLEFEANKRKFNVQLENNETQLDIDKRGLNGTSAGVRQRNRSHRRSSRSLQNDLAITTDRSARRINATKKRRRTGIGQSRSH